MPVRRLRAMHLLLIREFLRIFSSAAKQPKPKLRPMLAQLRFLKKLALSLLLHLLLVAFLLARALVDTLSVC